MKFTLPYFNQTFPGGGGGNKCNNLSSSSRLQFNAIRIFERVSPLMYLHFSNLQ